MSPDEFEAVAKRIEARADAREQEGASEQREAEGMRIAVAMFREAAARRRTSPCAPTRKTIRISEAVFSTWPSPFSPPRPIAEAGPGMWSVVALARADASGYDVEVMQLASAKVTP